MDGVSMRIATRRIYPRALFGNSNDAKPLLQPDTCKRDLVSCSGKRRRGLGIHKQCIGTGISARL